MTTAPERFFLIAGLHRWQELAGRDYPPSEASVRLNRLADRGPEAGIHVVAWAASHATAERALGRAGIGNFFGLRAVLRVSSPAESDALLGVPGADSLPDNRALYRDVDEPEEVEKFKPYSVESLRRFAETAFRSGP